MKFGTLDLDGYISSWEEECGNRLTPLKIAGVHGAVITEDPPPRDSKIVRVQGWLSENSDTTLRDKRDAFKGALYDDEQNLYLHSDRYLKANLRDYSDNYKEAAMALDFDAEFFCADPYEYALTPIVNQVSPYTSGNLLANDPSCNSKLFPSFHLYPTGGAISNITVTNTSLSPVRSFNYSGTIADGGYLGVSSSQYVVLNSGNLDMANFSGDFLWVSGLELNYISATFTGSPTVLFGLVYTPRWY